MNKSVKNYYKNKFFKYILLFILVIVPSVIIAYKPPPEHNCSKLQYSLTFNAEMFFMDNNYSFKSTSSDERFKELCSILFEKKYIKEPFRYYYKECSYGLILSDSNELKIYCKYHGNFKNAEKFSNMSLARYFAGKKESFYLILIFVCSITGILIYSFKAAYRKSSNKEGEDFGENI